jgi:hypothetical protein
VATGTNVRRACTWLIAAACLCEAGSSRAEELVIERYPEWDRFSVIYSPEISLSNSTLPAPNSTAGISMGTTIQNIGLEMSSFRGWPFGRYHAQIAYSNVNGVSGFRLDPLGIGWAVPLAWGRHSGVELEPVLMLVDAILFFTHDQAGGSNVTFFMSSGAELQMNLYADNFYCFVSPIGIELRYLEITSGAGGKAYGAADPYWRFRVGVGVQY